MRVELSNNRLEPDGLPRVAMGFHPQIADTDQPLAFQPPNERTPTTRRPQLVASTTRPHRILFLRTRSRVGDSAMAGGVAMVCVGWR